MTIIEALGRRVPGDFCLYAPGRDPLTYSALYNHVLRTARALRRAGIRRDDAVAVVLPNGPEMATAFLSVCTAGVCAPLNPQYTADEFEFYFSDLPAKALLISGLAESPARDVARRLGLPIIELEWNASSAAGTFNVVGDAAGDTMFPELPEADNVALVLHTSGTTSRPKIVPLTHANLAASASNVATTLELKSADICLNVMPLFHIHGLVAALLASLHAGAGVVCTPGFLAPNFFDWMREFRPTWYSAVPTIHNSVLARAEANSDIVESHRLRFIRSSSASLPATTLEGLEKTFRVPVVEAYGMTEAAHQMASNPLPPALRKPGTVGRAAGPSITILDAEGRQLRAGNRGEVAIKGTNVTGGYARNPDANAATFVDGWLRTGDEGSLDEDGYLTILGRLKEIINRSGEKISPLEVEEVILSHPAVAQAVSFAAPDESLGEEIAAAVVLRSGESLSERQLREFIAARVAYFKVPRRILFMDSLPTGPTGKLQRIGLADKLGISFAAAVNSGSEHVSPRTAVEEILASIWSTLLQTDSPGVHDNFFFAGGDSMLAAQFISQVRDSLSVEISLLSFFDSPRIADVALLADRALADEPLTAQGEAAASG
jgi:oxalate---CoA ligase